MDWISEWLIGFVSAENNPLALATLAGAAAVEYVFPPFPGDTITLFGAVLITAYGWNFGAVFGAVMLGSVAGTILAYFFGIRLRLWRSRRAGKRKLTQAVLDDLVAKFRRHGAIYLVLNRFMPGIRAVFFVAAGLAAMRPLPVIVYGTLSAALWNLGLIILGSVLGANLDTLIGWVKTYSAIAWIAIAAVVLVWVVRRWRARRRPPNLSQDPPNDSSGSSP